MKRMPWGTGVQRRLAVLTVAMASQFLCGAAYAQSDGERVKELERKLERSMQMIEQLTRRVNELEKGPAPAPAAAPPAVRAQEARIEALERNIGQMAMGHGAEHGEAGVPVHGFADVGYEYSKKPIADGRRAGFVLGNLDFFFTPNFGRVKMLAELNFEVTGEGGLATDLERMQLGYTFSDSFTAWMGRFHTPYGYWNTAFHHGAQIQAVTRPRFIDFEDKGGILPSHTVGLWANGRFTAGPGKFIYDVYIGNGDRIVDGVLDFNAFRDDNSNKAVGGNLGYRFGGALDGLLVGVHAMRADTDVYHDDALQNRNRLAFTGAYLYADLHNWEAIGEYYRFRNKDLSGGTGTHASWAGFFQVGRTFFDLWTPYYRWEKANLDPADNYFAAQESGRSYARNVLGVRYALNPNTALKLEANRTKEYLGEDKWYTELRAQFAVRF
jgi:hypothetical protein